MPGIESEQSVETTAQIFGQPFLRNYNPAKEYWQLTTSGSSRVQKGELPPHIPLQALAILHKLSEGGPMEADEISDWLNITNEAAQAHLSRLEGYDYVERAAAMTEHI